MRSSETDELAGRRSDESTLAQAGAITSVNR
jgi:hypothetical protein